MTRFEKACEDEFSMAAIVLFCVAAYTEQCSKIHFDSEEIVRFIEENQDTIAEWLMEEDNSPK